MKKYALLLLSYLKYLLILWMPILLIEETILLDYVGNMGSFICSLLMSILCLIMYIKDYRKKQKEKINCYIYNGVNALILGVSNYALGYLFMHLIEINIFHQCLGSGWDCFLFGIEYWLIGIEYSILIVISLIIWLIARFIKYLGIKKNNSL